MTIKPPKKDLPICRIGAWMRSAGIVVLPSVPAGGDANMDEVDWDLTLLDSQGEPFEVHDTDSVLHPHR